MKLSLYPTEMLNKQLVVVTKNRVLNSSKLGARKAASKTKWLKLERNKVTPDISRQNLLRLTMKYNCDDKKRGGNVLVVFLPHATEDLSRFCYEILL